MIWEKKNKLITFKKIKKNKKKKKKKKFPGPVEVILLNQAFLIQKYFIHKFVVGRRQSNKKQTDIQYERELTMIHLVDGRYSYDGSRSVEPEIFHLHLLIFFLSSRPGCTPPDSRWHLNPWHLMNPLSAGLYSPSEVHAICHITSFWLNLTHHRTKTSRLNHLENWGG